jgi:electron transfer flavoprotein beta subunit
MKVAVCAKVVPAGRQNRRIDPSSGRIVRDAGALSDLDRHAVEEALRIRERGEADEVLVVSMAPGASLGAVRDALAMGADRAIQVSDPALEGSDLLGTSRVLAHVLRQESPDLVIFGPQGEDSNGAMLWSAAASRLGLPVLSQVEELALEDGRARIVRQTEAGYETLDAPLPCVIGVTGSINQPRFAPVKGKIAAHKKPLALASLAQLGLPPDLAGRAGAGTTVTALREPPRRAEGQVVRGPDVEVEVYEFLRSKRLVP